MIDWLLNEPVAVHHEAWENPFWWWASLAAVVAAIIALFWPSRDLFDSDDARLTALVVRGVIIVGAAAFAVPEWCRHTADSRGVALVVIIVMITGGVAALIHHHKAPPIGGIPAAFLALGALMAGLREFVYRTAASIPLGPTQLVVLFLGAGLYGLAASRR